MDKNNKKNMDKSANNNKKPNNVEFANEMDMDVNKNKNKDAK